jgi:hypothetical protein
MNGSATPDYGSITFRPGIFFRREEGRGKREEGRGKREEG